MPQKPDPIALEREIIRQKERYMVLSECVTLAEAWVRRFSRNEAAQVAKEGYEKAFDEELRRKLVLQDIMRDVSEKIDACRRLMNGI